MWYMGKEFDKEKNKVYKTLDGGMKAAEKQGLNLYDENGQVVGTPKARPTDDVQEGALQENPDGSVNAYDADGNVVGTVSAEELAALQADAGKDFEPQGDNSTPNAENGQDGSQSDAEKGCEPEEVHGKIRRVFDGKLRLRRSPSWDASAACGVTMFEEKTVVQRVMVEGSPMYRTTDGYYVSGKPGHVKFIED